MATCQIAYVAVGANLKPKENIEAALVALLRFAPVKASSTFYETRPLTRPEQPSFLNGVWKIPTELSPSELKFGVLRKIESELGRSREKDRHAARPIDLDLILFGGRVEDSPGIKLPDPDIRLRPFIAVPLLELDPNLVLPDTKERLSSLPVSREASGMKALNSFSTKLRGFLKP